VRGANPNPDWKALVRGQGGDSVSPAFSMLDQRMTLLDGSLFVATASRNKELLVRFGVIGAALVDLAVTHEMGHGICQEKNERRADDYGRQLREGKTLDCNPPPGSNATTVAQIRRKSLDLLTTLRCQRAHHSECLSTSKQKADHHGVRL
jgi:hypothetical protein